MVGRAVKAMTLTSSLMNYKPDATVAASARGFTLIEISVVVVIFALMFTTATVSLDSYLPNSRSESAARELLSTIDLARTSAVANGREYQVEFDLERRRYRIVTPFDIEGAIARNNRDRSALSWVVMPSGVYFNDLIVAGGRELKKGTYLLSFSQVGSAEELWIHLGNEAGESYDLTARVIALTGHSKVFKGFLYPQKVTEDDI